MVKKQLVEKRKNQNSITYIKIQQTGKSRFSHIFRIREDIRKNRIHKMNRRTWTAYLEGLPLP